MKAFEKFQNEIPEFEGIICNNCRYYNKDLTCDAFPDGIPFEIIDGKNDHKKPCCKQKNDLIFKLK